MLLKSLLLLNCIRMSSNCPTQNVEPTGCSVAANVFPTAASVTNRNTTQTNNGCKCGCANCNNCVNACSHCCNCN